MLSNNDITYTVVLHFAINLKYAVVVTLKDFPMVNEDILSAVQYRRSQEHWMDFHFDLVILSIKVI